MANVTVGTSFGGMDTWWGVVGSFSYEHRRIVIAKASATTCKVYKSTDYGRTFSELTSFFGQDAYRIDSFADWECPGDTGTLVHVGSLMRDGSTNAQFYYRTIDMSSDSFTVTTEINFDPSTVGATSSSVQRWFVSIAINRAGHVGAIIRVNNNDAAHFTLISTVKGSSASFSSVGSTKWSRTSEQTDYGYLLPAGESNSNEDFWLVLWQDTSPNANTVSMKWWNDGAGPANWQNEQQMGATTGNILHTTYKMYDAMVRPDNGKALTAIWTKYDAAAAGEAELELYEADHDDSAGGFTFKTDIADLETNVYDMGIPVVMFDRDASTDESVIVGYLNPLELGTTGQIVTKRSTSQSGTWTWGSGPSLGLTSTGDYRSWRCQHVTHPSTFAYFMPAVANDDSPFNVQVDPSNQLFVRAGHTIGEAFKIDTLTVSPGPSATGVVDYTISGFGPPRAIIVIGSRATVAESITNDPGMTYGFYDGRAVEQGGIDARHNVGTSDCQRYGSQSYLYQKYDPTTNNLVGAGVPIHLIDDGVAIDWTDASNSEEFTLVFIGGDELEAHVGQITGAGSIDGTATETGVGFEPDFLFGLTNLGATSRSGDSDMSFGFAANVAGNPQGCQGAHGETGQGTTDTESVHSNTYVAHNTFDGSERRLEVTSWNADGFVVTTRISAATTMLRYLAIKLPAALSVDVGTIDTKASTGSQAYTGIGFLPQWLMLTGGINASENTTIPHASLSVAVMETGTDASHCYAWSDQDALDTSVSKQVWSQDGISILLGDGTLFSKASLTSFDSDGFTLNFSTATSARKMTYLTIGAAAAGGQAPRSMHQYRQRRVAA